MIIIQDTREQKPWDFKFFEECTGQIVQTLDTGDYTVQGYENSIIFERKKSSGEIYTNLCAKYPQFKAECERMEDFDYRFLVCEFPIEDMNIFPFNSGIPRKVWKKLRMNAKQMQDRLSKLLIVYDIEIVFCKNKEDAEKKVLDILNEIIR